MSLRHGSLIPERWAMTTTYLLKRLTLKGLLSWSRLDCQPAQSLPLLLLSD